MSYKDYSYDELNNTKHKTYIIHERTGANLGTLLPEKGFTLNDFIMNRAGGFQPNSSTVKIVVPRDKDGFRYKENVNLKDTVLQIPVLNGYDFSEPLFRNWDFGKDLFIQMNISAYELFKKGDKLRFIDEINGERWEFFTGYLSKTPSMGKTNSSIEINLEIKDATFEKQKIQATEDIFRQGWYICNNSSQDTSLLHFLAKKMGYGEQYLEFEDVIYKGEHVGVNVVKIDKGASFLKEFAEACRAVEARFHQVGDKLVVRSYLNEVPDGYTFDERNVLTKIFEEPQSTDNSQIKVVYDKIEEKSEKLVWALVGENGTVDNAKIKIAPNTTEENNKKWWRIDFRPSGVVSSYKDPEILADLADGTKVDLEYVIELDKNGGKLKLLNSLDKEVFLKKFKINGTPLNYFKGNSITYPVDDSKETFSPAPNKYIQHVNIAAAKAYNAYNYECRDYNLITFEANVSRWLVPGVVCTLNHKDYKNTNKNILIESIVRYASKCKIVAREYLGAVDAGDLEELEKTGATDDELGGTNLDNVVTVDPDRPPAPVVKASEPNVGGIVVKLEKYPRTDILNFEFQLTMVNPDNTPHPSGVVLNNFFNTDLVAIMLTNPLYYNKRWKVEVRAWDFKSKISDWSTVTDKCFAVSQRMPSEGIEDHSITTAKLFLTNGDAIYVDLNGHTRIKVDGVIIGPDENLSDKLGEVDKGISGAKTKAEEVDEKVKNGEIVLTAKTNIYAMLSVFGGGKGITSYNGTTESNSTKKIVIDGGEISYWEKT